MKRTALNVIFAILALACLNAPAIAEPVPARILIGAREAAVAPKAVRDGNATYAPISVLDFLAISYALDNDSMTASIVGKNGKLGSVRVAVKSGAKMVSLESVLGVVGGEVKWNPETKNATIYAHVQSAEFADGGLTINTSIPAVCELKYWDGRIIARIPYAIIATDAREISVGSELVTRVRLGNNGEDANAVIDLNRKTSYKLETSEPSTTIRALVGDQYAAVAKPAVSVTPEAKPYQVTSASIRSLGEDSADLVIETTGRPAVGSSSYSALQPGFALNLKLASLSSGAKAVEGTHPLVKNVRIADNGDGGLRVEVAASRILAYGVRVEPSSLIVSLRLPDKAGGKLSEKVIVLDAGHGGGDTGARFASIYEKDLNLRIVREIEALLREQGAAVILTRADDTKIGLHDRPQIAVSNYADLFVSIHCNSSVRKNAASGIETYYHMQEPSAKALAYAVHDGVCIATGMCDRRARSDSSLYSRGLAVLRGLEDTGIPGLLLECGYMNTDSDRANLTSAEFRKKLALGVVKGIKAYIEGIGVSE